MTYQALDTPLFPEMPQPCLACGRIAWDSQEGRRVCSWCGHYELDKAREDDDAD